MTSLKGKLGKALGDSIGAHIIPKNHTTWSEEHFFNELIRLLNPDCIFDVGANIGQFGQFLRKIGYKGLILSFEPSPGIFKKLKQQADTDSNWHAYQYALGDVDDSLPFNIMKHDVLSSFLAPSDDDDAPFKCVNVVSEVVNVPVKRLDMIYDELGAHHGFRKPILKMDTQGFDLRVIAGAGVKIANFTAILSEVAVRRLYKDNPVICESIEAFEKIGFNLLRMFPVHPRKILNPLEFNCYFLRHDLAA